MLILISDFISGKIEEDKDKIKELLDNVKIKHIREYIKENEAFLNRNTAVEHLENIVNSIKNGVLNNEHNKTKRKKFFYLINTIQSKDLEIPIVPDREDLQKYQTYQGSNADGALQAVTKNTCEQNPVMPFVTIPKKKTSWSWTWS